MSKKADLETHSRKYSAHIRKAKAAERKGLYVGAV